MKQYRRHLLKLINKHAPNPESGCEIGVLKGETAFHLGQAYPNCELTFVDPWMQWPEDSEYYNFARRDEGKLSQQEWDSLMDEAMRNLVSSHAKNFRILRMTSVDAAKHIADQSLDFTFIDACHSYESVEQDIEIWLPKTRKLICGHDYGNMYRAHVDKAVDEIFGDRVIALDSKVWAVKL